LREAGLCSARTPAVLACAAGVHSRGGGHACLRNSGAPRAGASGKFAQMVVRTAAASALAGCVAPQQLLHVARDVAPGQRQAAQRRAEHVALDDRRAAGAAVAGIDHRARQRRRALLRAPPAHVAPGPAATSHCGGNGLYPGNDGPNAGAERRDAAEPARCSRGCGARRRRRACRPKAAYSANTACTPMCRPGTEKPSKRTSAAASRASGVLSAGSVRMMLCASLSARRCLARAPSWLLPAAHGQHVYGHGAVMCSTACYWHACRLPGGEPSDSVAAAAQGQQHARAWRPSCCSVARSCAQQPSLSISTPASGAGMGAHWKKHCCQKRSIMSHESTCGQGMQGWTSVRAARQSAPSSGTALTTPCFMGWCRLQEGTALRAASPVL